MSSEKKFINYLSVLNDLYPSKQLIVVGAGSGSYVKTLKKLKINKALLLEANVMQIERLFKQHKLPKEYEVQQAYICKNAEKLDFYVSSFSDINGCQNIKLFKEFMPNVRLLNTLKIQSYSLQSFLQNKELEIPNWLIVDTYSSYEILKESTAILNDVDVLICRYLTKSKEILEGLLDASKFKKVHEFEQINPNVMVGVFVKKSVSKNRVDELTQKLQNLTAKAEAFQKESTALKEEKAKLATALDSKNKEIESLKKVTEEKTKTLETKINEIKALEERLKQQEQKFNQEKEELNTSKQAIQKQLEESNKKLQETTSKAEASQKELTTLKEEKAKLTTALEAKTQEIESLKEEKAKLLESKSNEVIVLEKKLKQQREAFQKEKDELEDKKNEVNQLKKQIEKQKFLDASLEELISISQKSIDTQKSISGTMVKIKNDLQAHTTKALLNTTKQLESFINVNNYLENGIMPLNFHGWPISPDIAQFLIQKIEENNYDLVLEFGSGTSTLLFAKALRNRENTTNGKEKILQVAFDHNEKYFHQTIAALATNSLSSRVDVVHTPLVPFQYGDDEFMYYDCKEKFSILKNDDKIKKILVLVDGPPGATCPLARFPALIYLLDAFNGKEIHLVLDDYAREEEKKTVSKWEQILCNKNISFKSESISSEKGLYFLQILKKG